MKLILAIILIFPFLGQAQTIFDHNKAFNASLRAKYIAFGFLEDLYWRGYNYGLSVSLYDRITIGMDGHVFRTKWENDEAGDEQYGIPVYNNYYRRTSIYNDIQVVLIKKDNIDFFVQGCVRWHGRYWEFNKISKYNTVAPIPFYIKDRARGSFTDVGGGIGCRFYVHPNFGLEASFNVSKRRESIEFTSFDENDIKNISNTSQRSTVAWLRTSLFFQIKGKETVD